jgi:hypothetical protein
MIQETELIKIDRDTAISQLTASMFDAMMQDEYYMEQVIEHGFKGFYNYTDAELAQEYRDYISEDPTYPVIIEFTEEL